MKRKLVIASMMMMLTVGLVKRVEIMREKQSSGTSTQYEIDTEVTVACANSCICLKTNADCPCVEAVRAGKSKQCNANACRNESCPCGQKNMGSVA